MIGVGEDGGMAPTRFGIFLFDEAEELDWAGPWEVLASWSQFHPDEAEVFTFARTEGPITCAKGLRVLPQYTWENCGPIHVLVYPGGQGTRQHLGDEEIHNWLRRLSDENALITSVCTGSLVLADAGLLDGRPATTHWASIDFLGTLGQNVTVKPDDRFVDSGEVITASGVSAGIDMALHLIARLESKERAVEVRRYIQYDPEPPV